MVDFDFHEVAFAVPDPRLPHDALDRRASVWAVGLSAVLLLVREDMGALVLMVAVIVLLRRKFLLATVLAAMGVGGYLVATAWVIPAFSVTGTFAYWTYDSLGPNLSGALGHVLRDLIGTVRAFLTPVTKTYTLLWTFGATTVFLALLSPYALISLPILAERFFSSREALWTTEFHYTGILAPAPFLGAVDTVHRLVGRFGDRTAVGHGLGRGRPRDPARRLARAADPVPPGSARHGGGVAADRPQRVARPDPAPDPRRCLRGGRRPGRAAADPSRLRDQPGHPRAADDLAGARPGPGPDRLPRSRQPNDYLQKAVAEGFRMRARDGSIVLLERPGPVDPLCRAYGP